VYLFPKCNATIRGSYVWKDIIVDLISYPLLFLSEYFRRENFESGFSGDKRCLWLEDLAETRRADSNSDYV
jgi:transposase